MKKTFFTIFLSFFIVMFLVFLSSCDKTETSITTNTKSLIKTTTKNQSSATINESTTSVSADITTETKEVEKTPALPKIYVYTDYGRAIRSKETYVDCSVSVTDSDYNFTSLRAGIRGRGNSTWAWDKKPYRIKFESKVDMFGNGKAKSWTLIANHCDLSLARNYFAYNIASRLDDMPYTTSCVEVEFYLNGSYNGVYLLCEQVQTGTNRVEVIEEMDGNPENTGYLIEMDVTDRCISEGLIEGFDYFILDQDKSKCYVLKTPDTEDESYKKEYLEYIKDYFVKVFDLLMKTPTRENYKELTELINPDTFADSYIVSELFNNCDVGWSMYLYKDKTGSENERLSSGPIWDFDISSGNCAYQEKSNHPETMWVRSGSFIYSNLLKYKEFELLVKEKLFKYYSLINGKIDELERELLIYEDSFNRNFERWNILSTGVYMGESLINTEEELSLGSWKNNLLYLTNWLKDSLNEIHKFYVG